MKYPVSGHRYSTTERRQSVSSSVPEYDSKSQKKRPPDM